VAARGLAAGRTHQKSPNFREKLHWLGYKLAAAVGSKLKLARPLQKVELAMSTRGSIMTQRACGRVQRLGIMLVGLVIGGAGWAAESPAGRYETGYSNLVAIASDLHQALDPAQRVRFDPVPVLLANESMPVIRPGVRTVGGQQLWTVEVSAGFIELLNFLSHAKAIDGVDRGFYRKSVASLAGVTGEAGLPGLQITQRKAWAFHTMNHQVSHFNQMAAALLGIQMAYHRLGYYARYAPQLAQQDSQSVPIALLLSPQEWLEAVSRGAHHALKCGFGIDGLCALFEGLDKMPNRPAWTFQFLPPGARAPKLRRQLEHTEYEFFLVSDVGREF